MKTQLLGSCQNEIEESSVKLLFMSWKWLSNTQGFCVHYTYTTIPGWWTSSFDTFRCKINPYTFVYTVSLILSMLGPLVCLWNAKIVLAIMHTKMNHHIIWNKCTPPATYNYSGVLLATKYEFSFHIISHHYDFNYHMISIYMLFLMIAHSDKWRHL